MALEPNFAEAYSNLGTTLEELGRLAEAKASWTKAIALKPDFVDGARNLAKLPVGELTPDILNLCEKALAVLDSSTENQIEYLFFQGNLLKHRDLSNNHLIFFVKLINYN